MMTNLKHTKHMPPTQFDPDMKAIQMGRRPRWEGDPDGKATQMERDPVMVNTAMKAYLKT